MKGFIPALFLALSLASLPAIADAALTGVVSWTAPTTNAADGSAITAPLTYQVYLGASGQESKSGAAQAGTVYQIPTLPAPGTTICAQVTAIAGGLTESARSVEACATVPFPTPGSPTVVTIVIK